MAQESLKTDYEDLRKKYDPREIGKDISVLFIAESPPAPNNEDNLPYFYNEKSQGKKRALWRDFSQALYGKELSNKEKFLEI